MLFSTLRIGAQAAFVLALGACAVPYGEEPPEVVDYVAPARVEAPVIERVIVLDFGLTMRERDATIEAAHAWEKATAGSCPVAFRFTLDRVDRSEFPPRGFVTVRETVRLDELPENVLGWAAWADDLSRARILYVPELDAETILIVAKHELGHTFGEQHTDVPPNDGVISGGSEITELDVQAVCRHLGVTPPSV